MDRLRRSLLACLLAVTAVPAAATDCTPPPATMSQAPVEAAPRAAASTRPRDGWWADHRWRYRTDQDAELAYQALAASQAPWPVWHQSNIVALPVGLRFQMALAPGQSSQCPGAFATFERIPSVEYVRMALAEKTAWKPAIERVVTYEVTAPLLADVGTVGPQIDAPANRYLPGGASQFQMMVPAAERMQHLRVVEERPIR